ncbi:hypothetical protein [Paenimyroides baculatum]|uniref:Uncharacterized protein n=1 Tax=Paenimyroides baculatum TaxID=2608000 RepID=A0A5M6CGK3_9FLAO|nr:hypothetical protein [Paenimyroides baculatum]KAA5534324.1 hypothetical protein F0460_09455 [Paenimyroides baculatum]
MSPKYVILENLIFILNQHSTDNVTLLHYKKSKSKKYFFSNEYFILLNTDDNEYAGKVFQTTLYDDNDNFLYEDIPFKYTTEKYYYFIDDLVDDLLKRFKNCNIPIDLKTSSFIKATYKKQWIHQLCNLNDNFNILDEMADDFNNI